MAEITEGFTLSEAMVIDASVKRSHEEISARAPELIQALGASVYNALVADHESAIRKISLMVRVAMEQRAIEGGSDA